MQLSIGKRIVTYILVLILISVQQGSVAKAVAITKADVKKASKGNVLVGVEGGFEYVSKTKILNRINAIRKEACKKGYINPSTGEKLTEDDYVPIKWSSDMERIAQLRAVEATVYESHTRPNGKDCFSIKETDESSSRAENLAWNYSGLMQGIEQWYGEKNDWVKQNNNAVTGHYTSMINPKYQSIGLGSFRRKTGGWYGVSAEFSSKSDVDETKSTLKGKRIQTIEVKAKRVGKFEIKAPSKIKSGQTKQFSVIKKITFPGIMGGKNVTNATPLGKVTWKSSKKSVLSINSSGKARAKKAGKVTITAKIAGGKSVKVTVKIKKK